LSPDFFFVALQPKTTRANRLWVQAQEAGRQAKCVSDKGSGFFSQKKVINTEQRDGFAISRQDRIARQGELRNVEDSYGIYPCHARCMRVRLRREDETRNHGKERQLSSSYHPVGKRGQENESEDPPGY